MAYETNGENDPLKLKPSDLEDAKLIEMESGLGIAGHKSLNGHATNSTNISSHSIEQVTDASDHENDIEHLNEAGSNSSKPLDLKRHNTLQKHIFLYFDELQIERYIRLIFSFVFIGGSIVIFYIQRGGSPYKNIAYCMALVQGLWLIQFLGVICTIEHLHSIVVFRKLVPNTTFLVVPYAVSEQRHQIMSSISAMSSLRGSNLFYLLGNSSAICFGMTFSAVSFKWLEFGVINWDTTSLGLLLISCFGSMIITGWELDTTSKLSTGLHYLGALVSFVAAPTAFAIYQHWSVLSICIMVLTYACLAVFGSVYQFASPEYPNDPVMVHRVSLFCIIVELIAVVNGMLCVILFIWCMEGNKILG